MQKKVCDNCGNDILRSEHILKRVHGDLKVAVHVELQGEYAEICDECIIRAVAKGKKLRREV